MIYTEKVASLGFVVCRHYAVCVQLNLFSASSFEYRILFDLFPRGF